MIYDFLGSTDLKVSKICLGTMTWGEQNTEDEAHQQLNYAIDQGINFIDTAELYPVPGREATQGLTEQYIGTWLKTRSDRDQLILATKAAGPSPGLKYIRNGPDFSPQQLNSALETSLKRLKTDYIDLYQLHWPERKTNTFGKLGYQHQPEDQWQDNIERVLQSLEKMISSGKVRYIGLSNEVPWGVHKFLSLAEFKDLPRIQSIQNPYSLLNRAFEVGLAEMAIREKVGLLAYSPLGFGRLSGKYQYKTADEKSRINQFKQFARYNAPKTIEATASYLKIAEKLSLKPIHLALAFVNSRPFLTSNIIGATSMQQLKENIESINITLPEEAYKAIEEVHKEISNPAP